MKSLMCRQCAEETEWRCGRMISSKRHLSKNFLSNTPLASLWIQSKGEQSEGRDSDPVVLRLEERFLDARGRELRCGDGEEMWDVN